MSYSDENIQLLKLYSDKQWYVGCGIKYLLERLKAAEKAICEHDGCYRCPRYIKAWEKAAGK